MTQCSEENIFVFFVWVWTVTWCITVTSAWTKRWQLKIRCIRRVVNVFGNDIGIRSGGRIAFYLGLDIINNVSEASDSLYRITVTSVFVTLAWRSHTLIMLETPIFFRRSMSTWVCPAKSSVPPLLDRLSLDLCTVPTWWPSITRSDFNFLTPKLIVNTSDRTDFVHQISVLHQNLFLMSQSKLRSTTIHGIKWKTSGSMVWLSRSLERFWCQSWLLG